MTLEEHFQLARPPFPKAAGRDGLLMTPGLTQVIKKLRFAIGRDTIAMLIAESGCGKSTALSLFSRTLDAASYNVISTSMTTLSPFSFIAHLVAGTGLPGRRFKGETAAAFLMHLRSQPKRTIILVDEAHKLPDDSLEDLRLLTADNLDQASPFSLILVGQPLLRERLAEPAHYALWQRIGVKLRLRPLTEHEVGPFLDHHLKAAGAAHKPLFESEAVAEIFHHSRGIPRLVRNLALDAMLAAMEAGSKSVGAQAVAQAVIEMDLD
ncbi:MAG: AAA family ATPase [Pseudomonadota bacterium]